MDDKQDDPRDSDCQCPSVWWAVVPIGILLIIMAVMAVFMWRWWRELSAQASEFNEAMYMA